MATVQASKTVKIFTFYGGLGYENSKMKIEYTNQDDDTNISFDLTGSNNIRFTAGLTFNFGPVKLNVDYNLASQSVLCAGLGIGIGDKK
jgi:predicted porin